MAARPWHALWTHSHCEHLVHHQLAAKGFELFLPEIDVWTRRGSPATSKLRRSLAVEVDCMLVAAA